MISPALERRQRLLTIVAACERRGLMRPGAAGRFPIEPESLFTDPIFSDLEEGLIRVLEMTLTLEQDDAIRVMEAMADGMGRISQKMAERMRKRLS